MGYDIHITRKHDWFEEGGEVISLDDWLTYISNDPDMRADGYAEATAPDGATIRVDSPGIAVWTAYSGHGVDGNMAWFSHFENRITVKNPDEEILKKMSEIAAALGAKVQGDEGEEYGPDRHSRATEPDPLNAHPGRQKPWWKFWG